MKLFAIISACLVASAGGAYYFTTGSTCSKGTCNLPVAKSGGCCAKPAAEATSCCPNPCPECATSCPECCVVCCATTETAKGKDSCCDKAQAVSAKAKATCCATPCPECANGCKDCCDICEFCCGAAKAVVASAAAVKAEGCCGACDVTPTRNIVLASKSIVAGR